MSVQTPPTFQKLACQTLLRDEAVAMSTLEKLPHVLFPALLKEACIGRHIKLVKAIVEAWPFPCLPVGGMMESLSLETFQAVLDGVDLRIRFHPRREKLQVLDLRNVHHAFWNMWDGTRDTSSSIETLKVDQEKMVLPRYALRSRLKVIDELCSMSCLSETQACLLKWAQQRKGTIRFCCTKMRITALPIKDMRQILNVFDPEHITELEVNTDWTLLELGYFSRYFGLMRNLHKVFLAPVKKLPFPNSKRTRDREAKSINNFISKFSKFKCLQHLFLNRVRFLRDHMDEVLWRLRTPLETLSITRFIISQRSLNYFSCCQSLFKLKYLEIRGVILYGLDLMPLMDFLEKVADTLETLDFQGCRMKDSQLSTILPALRQCSQLKNVNFYNNNFSMPILKDLLQHTANWSKIEVEQYPAPLECYNRLPDVSIVRFSEHCLELMDTLCDIRQPKSISFATEMCRNCHLRCVYGQDVKLCGCWQ